MARHLAREDPMRVGDGIERVGLARDDGPEAFGAGVEGADDARLAHRVGAEHGEGVAVGAVADRDRVTGIDEGGGGGVLRGHDVDVTPCPRQFNRFARRGLFRA